MKNLIIVGAGGFGREALYLAKAVKEANNPDWCIKGFIDDNLHALDGKDCDYPILGTISDWHVGPDEVFVIGVASPLAKEKLVEVMRKKGAEFISLIHPRAAVNEKAKIGNGCLVGGSSSVGDCARIGNFVHLSGCMVGQDASVGDFSTLTGFVNVTTAQIGKKVFIGSHAVVLNGLTVGDEAFICAGSIVFSNVKPGRKVIGYPAKKIDL